VTASKNYIIFGLIKIQTGLIFWYWLTQVVLEKRPLNGCVYVCYSCSILIKKFSSSKPVHPVMSGCPEITDHVATDMFLVNYGNDSACIRLFDIKRCF